MAAFAEIAPAPSLVRSRAPVPEPARTDARGGRSLAAFVVDEIVPRLMLAHTDAPHASATAHRAAPATLSVEAVAPLTLAEDVRPLMEHVEALLARGVAVDALLIDLLAPVARRLGAWWEEDRCDFVEVTIGLWRLQQVVREVTRRDPPRSCAARRRALFAALPGDQHDFGATMVSEYFRQQGWEAAMIVGADMTALLAGVAGAHYDIVGLTVSNDCHSARLRSTVAALRSVSRNPSLRVMIGGRAVNADASLVGGTGADGTAVDAREALCLAEALVEAVARQAACG